MSTIDDYKHARQLLVDKVDSEEVACDESEMFCPECGGRGVAYYVASTEHNKLHHCLMCRGTGRLYLKETSQ